MPEHTAPAAARPLRRLLQVLGALRWMFLPVVLLAAGSVVLRLYIPVLAGRAIDAITAPGQVQFRTVADICLNIALMSGCGALLQWLLGALNNRITCRVSRQLRVQAFAHIQQLPLRYLDAHPIGELVSRIITDVDQLADGLLLGFSQLFTGVITILGTLVFMLRLHAGIALLVVALTPLSLLTARFIARRTYALFGRQSAARGRQTAFINEMIDGQRVVRAFGHEAAVQRQFDTLNDELEQCTRKAVFFSSLTNPCTRFVNSVVYASVGLIGALSAAAGGLSVGDLSCFLSYANQYTKPFNEISGVIAELQNALACAARVFALLDEPPQTPDSPAARTLQDAAGAITLQQVAFSYTPQRPLLQDLSLQAPAGSRIAIVGPTGCGKTTLINLLMRFYDVDAGKICVDGIDVRDLARSSLRRHWGMVLQDTWLCSGTVRDNIRLGRPDADDAAVEAAARAAHAHAFIRQLPQGYDTPLGEAGGGLSQGQRQLLCIARVMLCQPPMLILDEATSSIDTRTEVYVQDAFRRLMAGRTCFIVAHRLSTIRDADCILVMREGKVVEQGRHGQLLAAGGFYAQLYNSQFAG